MYWALLWLRSDSSQCCGDQHCVGISQPHLGTPQLYLTLGLCSEHLLLPVWGFSDIDICPRMGLLHHMVALFLLF